MCLLCCLDVVGEKGIGLEPRTITVAVCAEILYQGRKSVIEKLRRRDARCETNVLYGTSQKTCIDVTVGNIPFFGYVKHRNTQLWQLKLPQFFCGKRKDVLLCTRKL